MHHYGCVYNAHLGVSESIRHLSKFFSVYYSVLIVGKSQLQKYDQLLTLGYLYISLVRREKAHRYRYHLIVRILEFLLLSN